MKVEKFKILQHIRELLILIDNEMDNFSKKDIELKNRIRNNSFDILELAYEANTITDVQLKINLLLKLLAKLKIIDFLLNLSYDKKIITSKKYIKFGNKIGDILKYANGWIKALSQHNK